MMNMGNKCWVRGSCIGRGANGTVYLAVDLSDGHVFAVKSVDSSSSLPSQLQALENEIKILKSISSPFIVSYLGDDTTASFRNLHIEYLPRGIAADQAAESEDLVRSYTWCLVSALSYLHSRGITHCDVKGRNVLLGPSPGSAKLADFGSAVETTSSGSPTRGSPLWMAPEVIRGEYQGQESDVWSLGCTVIEMLTGKPPIWGANAEPVRRIGWSEELPLFPAQLSSSGRDFLEKCFRRDYTERWSCDQLLGHPFVSVCQRQGLIAHSSPRCVLDGFNLNSDDEDGDVGEFVSNLNLEAEQRIRGLVSGAGANWYLSDGWVVVRGGGMQGGEGANLEYSHSSGADVEIREMISVDSSVNPSTNSQNYSPMCDIAAPQQLYRHNDVIMQSSEVQKCHNIDDLSFFIKIAYGSY